MSEDNLYLTISKTADKVGVPSHVLRFWEKKFLFIKPKKGTSGRRYYSPSDIEFLLKIKELLYVDKFTIKGAVNFINENYKNKENLIDDSLLKELDKAINLIKQGSKLVRQNIQNDQMS